MDTDINELKIIPYKPFPNVEGFSIHIAADKRERFLTFDGGDKRHYLLEIRPDGYVPKTGLLLARTIEKEVENKQVLDLCTGETGIIAIHSAVYKATSVLGVDLDTEAVEWAAKNSQLNKLLNTHWRASNLFSEVNQDKFDIIVTNPPQMPMITGHSHDFGGKNGRHFIERIIEQAPYYLKDGGCLYMIIFDFLGVDDSYSDAPPLRELFDSYGFDVEILTTEMRLVRSGGQTQKSLEHIIQQFPRYKFQVRANDIFHFVSVVKAILR